MVLAIIVIVFVAVIYATWWKLIDDSPQQKMRELGLSLVGGIIIIAAVGGLVYWLCLAIAGMTHETLTF